MCCPSSSEDETGRTWHPLLAQNICSPFDNPITPGPHLLHDFPMRPCFNSPNLSSQTSHAYQGEMLTSLLSPSIQTQLIEYLLRTHPALCKPSEDPVIPDQQCANEHSLTEKPALTSESLYKTELCRSWCDNTACRYGTKCQFAHGPEELRPIKRHPKYKTEVCRTFAKTGECPYGIRCRFIHPISPLPIPQDPKTEILSGNLNKPMPQEYGLGSSALDMNSTDYLDSNKLGHGVGSTALPGLQECHGMFGLPLSPLQQLTLDLFNPVQLDPNTGFGIFGALPCAHTQQGDSKSIVNPTPEAPQNVDWHPEPQVKADAEHRLPIFEKITHHKTDTSGT